jgi:methylglutaconyl-CoA hydratase
MLASLVRSCTLPALQLQAQSAALSRLARQLPQPAAGLWERRYSTAELQVQVEPLSSPNEGISVISLCRSNAKNAIGRQLLRELQEAINTLRQERTTRCVVVRSTCPGTFCAGADLKVGTGATTPAAPDVVREAFAEAAAVESGVPPAVGACG